MEFRLGRVSQEVKKENEGFTERIAAINGLKPTDVSRKEVKVLYKSIAGNRVHPLTQKYFGVEDNKPSRELSEKAQQFGQLAEALLDRTPRIYSVGLFGMDYMEGLKQQREEVPTKGRMHRSLLAGALTQDTVREHASIVRSVYNNALCYTADVEGEAPSKIEPKISGFVYGDALRLPFADGVFDSIHTNVLLRNLKDPSQVDTLPEEKRQQFFSEAARTLSDNGRLFLVEDHRTMCEDELRDAGFSIIVRTPATKFYSRREMERALKFEKTALYKIAHSPTIDFITAVKQK